MNSQPSRFFIRAAIFGIACLAAVYLWNLEKSASVEGGIFSGLAVIVLVPTFLAWFFAHEVWQTKITPKTILLPCGLLLILFGASRLDRGIDRIRRGGPRMYIANNLKQISLAMHNYQASFGTFPPAILRDKDGKALHTWRVLLLPYLEENDLYSKFHLDEPWDSPHNIALAEQMPRVYAGPEEIAVPGGKTFFQVLVGPGTSFEGGRGFKSPQDFPDGIESTILVVEARRPVPWTQPIDLPFSADGALPEFGAPRGTSVPSVFTAAMVDGSVRAIKTDISADAIRTLITRNGGEKPAEID
jgi:Protein of unknown function (DUF1559)